MHIVIVFGTMQSNNSQVPRHRLFLVILLVVLKLERIAVAFTVSSLASSSTWTPSFAFGKTASPLLPPSFFSNVRPPPTWMPTALQLGMGSFFGDEIQHDFFSLPSSSSSSSPSSSFSYREATQIQRFATGNDLTQLRADLEKWKKTFVDLEQQATEAVAAATEAAEVGDSGGPTVASSCSISPDCRRHLDELLQTIEKGEKRDPDIVYEKARKEVILAKTASSLLLSNDERLRLVQTWTKEVAEARKCIARFQLEGLWVGKFDSGSGGGQELINVTYSGDTLIATKVIGDTTSVPRGQVSFTAELSPSNFSALTPINVSAMDADCTSRSCTDAKKTTPRPTPAHLLWRYPGKGQIICKDKRSNSSKNQRTTLNGRCNNNNNNKNKFVDGQLLMLNDWQFSFMWIPTSQFVVFSRPTPEQTIHLLRDTIAYEDELENMRHHVTRCFDMDMTESLARFHSQQDCDNPPPIRRIKLNAELAAAAQKAEQVFAAAAAAMVTAPIGPGGTVSWGGSSKLSSSSPSLGRRLTIGHLSTKWQECIERILGNNTERNQ